MEERQDKRRTLPGLAAEPPPSERITLAMPLHPNAQAAIRANASTLVSATPPAPSVRSAEWCVDTGGALVPMSTFELWNAIEQGDVAKDARAWCEGLECWTPIERIAAHMATSLTPTANATGATPTPTATEATTNPTAPAPVPLEAGNDESAEIAAQPGRRATARSLDALRARRPSGVFGVALGSAVAAAAVSAALLLRIEAPAPPEVRVGVTVAPPAAKPAATAETKADETREELRRLQSAVELGPRHAEPGQRRRRR